MTNFDDPITISHGMHVYGSDGEKVGTVEDMRGNTMVVSKGWFFPTEHYIPTSAINSVDGDRVYLTVTRDEALNQGWDVEPVMDETVVTETPIVDAGLQIQNPVPNVGEPMATGVAVGEVEETDWVADTTADTDSDNLATGTVEGDEAEVVRVPLAEE